MKLLVEIGVFGILFSLPRTWAGYFYSVVHRRLSYSLVLIGGVSRVSYGLDDTN